jgi:hypothetical protein
MDLRLSGDAPLFQGLTSLHLYCYPRLAHALPWTRSALKRLETLEIMWCGDLKMVFKIALAWYLGKLLDFELEEKRVFSSISHQRFYSFPFFYLAFVVSRD